MFNTALGSKSVYDSYLFRRKAIEQQIPYYTTVEAAIAGKPFTIGLGINVKYYCEIESDS